MHAPAAQYVKDKVALDAECKQAKAEKRTPVGVKPTLRSRLIAPIPKPKAKEAEGDETDIDIDDDWLDDDDE